MNFFESELRVFSPRETSDSSALSTCVDPVFNDEIVSKKRPITDISIEEDMPPTKILVWGITKLIENQEHSNKRHDEMMAFLLKSQESVRNLRDEVKELGKLVTNKGNAIAKQIKTTIGSTELNDICTNTLLVIMKFGLDFHYNRNFVLPFKNVTGDFHIIVAIFPLMVCMYICVLIGCVMVATNYCFVCSYWSIRSMDMV
jgi:hypothetical protein